MRFVRYDTQTGNIISTGDMEERHIDKLNTEGDALIKIYDSAIMDIGRFRVNLESKLLESKPTITNTSIGPLKSLIEAELQRSDYTQLADASNHLTTDEIESWKQYRAALRTAYNASTYEEMVSALPATIPKGDYPFFMYK